MKEMTFTTRQLIAIAEYAGLTIVNKNDIAKDKHYILVDLLDVQTEEGLYYGPAVLEFSDAHRKARILEFGGEGYQRAQAREKQIQNYNHHRQSQEPDTYQPPIHRYSHYTDFQINLTAIYRRYGYEIEFDTETEKVWSSLDPDGAIFDLLKNAEDALSLLEDCQMSCSYHQENKVWSVTSLEKDTVEHQSLPRAIAECFLLMTDHYADDWPNIENILY
ncbi:MULTISPECIES: hypothetical protein [Enterobacterales]|nr:MULTISPECIES: hypothetical protein [Enterobacterales]WOO50582.1 hypothetical protein R2S03_05185 [Hafnia alvei]ODQ06069.1 hypothetical protein BGK50_02805 [Shigella sp. FC130]OEI93582.1 hypothetical protein BHE86_02815 [Shigella sp. FC1655]OEJ06595.1 hypothetical protein BHE89_06630 [Shigella sp. FC1967]WPF05050.1 hypothetical protein SB028_04035 [Proteus vulgaris]